MAETVAGNSPGLESRGADRVRTIDEVALDMMKFIALTTGYGKPGAPSAGFVGKAPKSTSEEYADALIELFDRCREVIRKGHA